MPVQVAYYDTLEFVKTGSFGAGNNLFQVKAPFRGEVLEYTGFLGTLGIGAGESTDIQVRNVDKNKNYFATRPTFEVDAATRRLEGGELIASPTFEQGEWLRLDAPVVPSGGNPSDLTVRLLCQFIREVSL